MAARFQSQFEASPSTLATEVLGDGHVNCLERAATDARGHYEMVFMDDLRSAHQGNENGAGHVVLRDPASGRVWDPNDGPAPSNPKIWPHRDASAWAASKGAAEQGGGYREVTAVPASEVQAVLARPPETRTELLAKNPALARVGAMLVADGDPLPSGAAAGLAFPPLANVVQGSHGTAATTAVQILETMSEGRPAFRPDLGHVGGVQWFVTEGAPHVGPGATNSVTIPVEVAAPRGAIEFGERELTAIFEQEMTPARELAERQYRTRKGLPSEAPLSNTARRKVDFNAKRIAERRMWTRVGEQVANSRSGVGRVTLSNSRFSRGGDGTFMLTSRPEAARVRGGAKALVDIIQRHGQPVEKPVLDAARRVATKEGWAGRLQGAFRVGGRVLLIAGAAADGYRIYTADDKVRETVKVAGGWAGATAAGGAFASWASPSLTTGPWGWLGYGLGTLGAGAAGYFVGESVAEETYELVVDGDPIYVGPRD